MNCTVIDPIVMYCICPPSCKALSTLLVFYISCIIIIPPRQQKHLTLAVRGQPHCNSCKYFFLELCFQYKCTVKLSQSSICMISCTFFVFISGEERCVQSGRPSPTSEKSSLLDKLFSIVRRRHTRVLVETLLHFIPVFVY